MQMNGRLRFGTHLAAVRHACCDQGTQSSTQHASRAPLVTAKGPLQTPPIECLLARTCRGEALGGSSAGLIAAASSSKSTASDHASTLVAATMLPQRQTLRASRGAGCLAQQPCPLLRKPVLPISCRAAAAPEALRRPASLASLCSSSQRATCSPASSSSRARAVRCSASAAAGAMPAPVPAPAPAAKAPQIGVKPIPAAIAIAVGLAVKFLVPAPASVTPEAWSLFSIFLSTIFGLVLEPLPVGAWAFCALTALVATKTLTFAAAMQAMTSEVIWLIVISFFFAKAFETTGLGERIANMFVAAMGKSTLGLAYGLMIAETLVSPAMPSTTARAGGIFMPIIKFLSKNAGSEPDSPSRKRLGAFLVQNQLQTSSYSSAVFVSASAQNLLCLNMAAALGAVVDNAWTTWFVAAAPPCIIGLLVTPYLLYLMYPPEVKQTPEAPAQAREALAKMGPFSRNEIITTATIAGAVVLWVLGESIGVPAVLAAMLGLTALLCTGVLSWRDCLTYTPAWDTLFWFAVLIGMSGALNDAGIISAFTNMVGGGLASLNLGWFPCFLILNVAFFTVHYLFASQTAHIGALFTAFTAMCIAAGAPPVLSVLCLSYNGNLFGGITHFASGQAALYYGSGFCNLGEFFSVGAIFGYFSLALLLIVGLPWWKFLGLW